MDVTSATSASSQTGIAAKSLSGNFDTFLRLLTAQLQNQDPLEPMDSNQFTQQLVQYSSVEQGIYTNKNLETLIALQRGGGLGSAVNYIGRQVTANSSDAALKTGGSAMWSYSLPRDAASVSLTVTDADGRTVHTGTGSTTAGTNAFVWDGKTGTGAAAPAGVYTLKIKALDAGGASLSAPVVVTGTVKGVSSQNGEVLLDVGGLTLRLDAVTAVREVPTES